MLASMRLCANVPAMLAVQTALGGYQTINDLVKPGGRLREQRDLAFELMSSIPGVTCVKPKAAMYLFPKLDPAVYPFLNDEKLVLDFLKAERVLLVQGSAFNWPGNSIFDLFFSLKKENLLRQLVGLQNS